ncbi:MAG: hypothetical protein HRU40_07500 [Saprospiraceae bacterium]|nr:hypothetical protein [Saprospiraceae bacterium]
MDLQDFKNKIDNRELWGYNNKENWELAYKWCDKRNYNLEEAIKWSFDCGFKLDFDGNLLSVFSRFYPPHKSHEDYGKWHGSVTFHLLGDEIHKEEIEANTLDEIADFTENYVKSKIEELKPIIKGCFN